VPDDLLCTRLDFTPKRVLYDEDEPSPGLVRAQSVYEGLHPAKAGDVRKFAFTKHTPLDGGVPPAVSFECEQFIRWMLTRSARRRPSATECLVRWWRGFCDCLRTAPTCMPELTCDMCGCVLQAHSYFDEVRPAEESKAESFPGQAVGTATRGGRMPTIEGSGYMTDAGEVSNRDVAGAQSAKQVLTGTAMPGVNSGHATATAGTSPVVSMNTMLTPGPSPSRRVLPPGT